MINYSFRTVLEIRDRTVDYVAQEYCMREDIAAHTSPERMVALYKAGHLDCVPGAWFEIVNDLAYRLAQCAAVAIDMRQELDDDVVEKFSREIETIALYGSSEADVQCVD